MIYMRWLTRDNVEIYDMSKNFFGKEKKELVETIVYTPILQYRESVMDEWKNVNVVMDVEAWNKAAKDRFSEEKW